MMSKRNRVLAVILVAVLMVTGFIMPEKATGAGLALTAVDFFMAGWATYAASHGLDMTLVNNGVNASPSAPMSSSSMSALASGLWAEYNAVTQDYQNIDAWLNAFQNSLSYVPAQSGTNVAFSMARELAGWYDEFANWILTQKYDCTRTESGFSHSSGTFDSPLISIGSFLTLPVSSSYPTINNGLNCGNNTYQNRIVISCSTVTPVYPYLQGQPWNGTLCAITDVPGGTVFVSLYDSTGTTVIETRSNDSPTTSGTHYLYNLSYAVVPSTSQLPLFSNATDAVAYFYNTSETVDSISLRPKDKYNELPIPVPDTAAQGYESDVLTGDWAIEGTENMTLDDALAALLARVQANQGVLVAEGTDGDGGGDDNGNSDDPDDYQALGLADVFPFCLPFDLYNFFACLGADPVAPSFEVPINFPPLNYSYTFEIDLSAFNTVAAILRKMELLGFCVALILISRQKLLRG